jgi:hypothetical protein
MKLWKLASTVALGVYASGVGMLQVSATDYTFFEDFSTKEVANFNEFEPIFTDSTNSLSNSYTFEIAFDYTFSSCPSPNTPLNVDLRLLSRIGSVAPFTIQVEGLPDLTCTTGTGLYFISITRSLTLPFLETMTTPDDNFLQFWPLFRLTNQANYGGRILTITNPQFIFNFTYNFGTTYMFSHFLSDSQHESFYNFGFTASGSSVSYIDYVYTTAGNDTYYIYNTNQTNVGTTRKKYAINSGTTTFRGESIGLEYDTNWVGTYSRVIGASGVSEFGPVYRYYYFNASNNQTEIVDVPQFEFVEEDCGDFLALNVPCFINNGLAYLVNDAPIISEAFTLLNAGMNLGGQAFGIIGQFTTDNVFGVLILGGLGITAVRWFLKQD